jgi:hypothetical protein
MQKIMSVLFGFGLVTLVARPALAAELAMPGQEALVSFLFSALVFAGLVQGIFYLLHLYRKRN